MHALCSMSRESDGESSCLMSSQNKAKEQNVVGGCRGAPSPLVPWSCLNLRALLLGFIPFHFCVSCPWCLFRGIGGLGGVQSKTSTLAWWNLGSRREPKLGLVVHSCLDTFPVVLSNVVGTKEDEDRRPGLTRVGGWGMLQTIKDHDPCKLLPQTGPIPACTGI